MTIDNNLYKVIMNKVPLTVPLKYCILSPEPILVPYYLGAKMTTLQNEVALYEGSAVKNIIKIL